MSVKCSVCSSEHREYIEQQKEAGVSLREISEALRVKWNIRLSHTTLGKHFTEHTTLTEESAVATAEALEKRVRNLERSEMRNLSGAQYTAWTSYTRDSQALHAITYKDILAAAIPESEALEQEYMDSIKALKAKQQKESGLVLNDSEFDAERAEIKQKAEDAEKKRIKDEEARKVECAMQELRDIETQKELMQEMLETTAKKQERRNRLQELRDKKLEEDAGIDENGDTIEVT